jgi:hypothetical protein
MNMSLPKFDALTSRFPHEQQALKGLAELVRSSKKREMTFDHLVSWLNPRSVESLALILAELTRAGVVTRVIRVESRTHSGIGDFASLNDIPPRMHDYSTDEEIEVTPDNLRIVYKVG